MQLYIELIAQGSIKKSVGECVISKKSDSLTDIYLFAKHSFCEKIVHYYYNLVGKL